jgi:hypothetical protein
MPSRETGRCPFLSNESVFLCRRADRPRLESRRARDVRTRDGLNNNRCRVAGDLYSARSRLHKKVSCSRREVPRCSRAGDTREFHSDIATRNLGFPVRVYEVSDTGEQSHREDQFQQMRRVRLYLCKPFLLHPLTQIHRELRRVPPNDPGGQGRQTEVDIRRDYVYQDRAQERDEPNDERDDDHDRTAVMAGTRKGTLSSARASRATARPSKVME